MNRKELAEHIFQIEESLDLLDRTVTGVHFWERIREPVYSRLLNQITEPRTDEPETANFNEYSAGIRLLLKNTIKKNPFFSDPSDILFYGTGRRKKLEDDFWWDVYIDPIIEDVQNWDCSCLERPFNISHRTPAKTSNLRYTDLIEYTGTVLHKMGISTISFSDEERSFLKTIENEIQSQFGRHLPVTRMVKQDLSLRRSRLPLYRKLIRRIEPNVVVLVNSYGGRETFVEACQSIGVPVVELQHGVIGRYHLGYSFPESEKKVFPDYFFSFGEFWSDATDLPLPETHIYSIGYPHLEKESKKYADTETKNQTVFISQVSIAEDLSRFAAELSRCEAYEDDIIYKFHPSQSDAWEEKFPWLVESDVTCITDEVPLYRLFAESTKQVGVYSTALYEGLRFGLDTYILETSGHGHMKYLIENEYVISVSSVEEFLSKQKQKDEEPIADSDYFFEQDPIERFEESIGDIM